MRLTASYEEVVMNENSEISEIIGAPVTELDQFWLKMARRIVKESIGSLEDAARQLITVVTLVEGIYFAAISFSDVRKVLTSPGQPAWVVFLFISPIILWLICLVFAIRVFSPESYRSNMSSPELAKNVYLEIVAYKHKMLRRAYLSLLIGFIPFIIAIGYYLLLPVAP